MAPMETAQIALRGVDHHPVWPDQPDDPGDVTPQLVTDGQPPIRIAEEVDVGDTERCGGLALLVLPDAGNRGARNVPVESPRVTVGHDAVRHLDTGGGPGRDRGAAPEVHVVRMRRHHQDPIHLSVVHDLLPPVRRRRRSVQHALRISCFPGVGHSCSPLRECRHHLAGSRTAHFLPEGRRRPLSTPPPPGRHIVWGELPTR